VRRKQLARSFCSRSELSKCTPPLKFEPQVSVAGPFTRVDGPTNVRFGSDRRQTGSWHLDEEFFPTCLSIAYTDISNGFNTLTFLSSANRKTLILWDVVGAHLSLQLCPNGSEAADDPRVERDAIHGIKPNSVPRDEGHYTFGGTCIVSRFDQFVCHLLPARRTLSNVAR
jgi:hypothetical protein